MFESTLEAQGLHEGDRKLGTLSVAALAHVGIGVLILAVTALIVPPVRPPELPPPIFVLMPQIPLGDLTPRPAPPAPRKGSESAKPGKAIVTPPVPKATVPLDTPDTLRTVVANDPQAGPDVPGEGSFGDPNGSPDGTPGAPGSGGGGGGGGGGDDSGPMYVTGEMQRPVLLEKVEPQYPDTARRARLTGRVTVRAVIGEDGSVESAEVVGSTNSLFDQAARGAVRKWRYSPALMNGKPVRVYFTVVVTFVLH